MNVPPEQIGSGEAGRPGRPRRSAQLHPLTSKALPKGGGEGGGGRSGGARESEVWTRLFKGLSD